MQIKFHQVPIGAQFIFRGQSFTQTALSIGQDDHRTGNIFQYEADMESDAMSPDPQAGFQTWARYEARHGKG